MKVAVIDYGSGNLASAARALALAAERADLAAEVAGDERFDGLLILALVRAENSGDTHSAQSRADLAGPGHEVKVKCAIH